MIETPPFDIIINRRSGTVLAEGEDKVARHLAAALGDQLGDIRFVDGAGLESAILNWKNTAAQNRRLIVGGGDGSVLTAAACLLNSGLSFGTLPLGTHNLVSGQMGFSPDYREAARQYKNSGSRALDVGSVNGMLFLFGLAFGRPVVRFFEAREELRDRKRWQPLKKLFSIASDLVTGGSNTILQLDGESVQGSTFLVSNNAFAPRPVAQSSGASLADYIKTCMSRALAKGDEADGHLAFYGSRIGLIMLPGMLRRLWNGTWHRHESMAVRQAQTLTIDSGAPARATTIVLDGEIRQTQFPLNVSLLPGALRMYRPG